MRSNFFKVLLVYDASRSENHCCKTCSEPVTGTCMDLYGLFPISYHQKDLC